MLETRAPIGMHPVTSKAIARQTSSFDTASLPVGRISVAQFAHGCSAIAVV